MNNECNKSKGVFQFNYALIKFIENVIRILQIINNL